MLRRSRGNKGWGGIEVVLRRSRGNKRRGGMEICSGEVGEIRGKGS
jgi:hypothetical protein